MDGKHYGKPDGETLESGLYRAWLGIEMHG